MYGGKCIKTCILDTDSIDCWVRNFHVGILGKRRKRVGVV